MGGFGSGIKASRKTLLEESWVLPAHRIVASLGLPVVESPITLPLTYTVPGSAITLWCHLTAEASRPYFGGTRWWWKCACGRRVSALFLPPTCATDFRCRFCHNLAYRSVQQHDKRVDYYRSHPEAAIDALEGPLNVRNLFLVLRSRETRRGGLQAARMPAVSA